MESSSSSALSTNKNCCAYCGKAGASNKCSRCSVAVYCDRTCQVAHWKGESLTSSSNNDDKTMTPHRDQCKALRAARERGKQQASNGGSNSNNNNNKVVMTQQAYHSSLLPVNAGNVFCIIQGLTNPSGSKLNGLPCIFLSRSNQVDAHARFVCSVDGHPNPVSLKLPNLRFLTVDNCYDVQTRRTSPLTTGKASGSSSSLAVTMTIYKLVGGFIPGGGSSRGRPFLAPQEFRGELALTHSILAGFKHCLVNNNKTKTTKTKHKNSNTLNEKETPMQIQLQCCDLNLTRALQRYIAATPPPAAAAEGTTTSSDYIDKEALNPIAPENAKLRALFGEVATMLREIRLNGGIAMVCFWPPDCKADPFRRVCLEQSPAQGEGDKRVQAVQQGNFHIYPTLLEGYRHALDVRYAMPLQPITNGGDPRYPPGKTHLLTSEHDYFWDWGLVEVATYVRCAIRMGDIRRLSPKVMATVDPDGFWRAVHWMLLVIGNLEQMAASTSIASNDDGALLSQVISEWKDLTRGYTIAMKRREIGVRGWNVLEMARTPFVDEARLYTDIDLASAEKYITVALDNFIYGILVLLVSQVRNLDFVHPTITVNKSFSETKHMESIQFLLPLAIEIIGGRHDSLRQGSVFSAQVKEQLLRKAIKRELKHMSKRSKDHDFIKYAEEQATDKISTLKERYKFQVSKDSVILAEGDDVKLTGLKSAQAQKLNGVTGRILNYQPETDRYGVKCGNRAPVAIKRENIEFCHREYFLGASQQVGGPATHLLLAWCCETNEQIDEFVGTWLTLALEKEKPFSVFMSVSCDGSAALECECKKALRRLGSAKDVMFYFGNGVDENELREWSKKVDSEAGVSFLIIESSNELSAALKHIS